MHNLQEIKNKVILEINNLTDTNLDFECRDEQEIDFDSFTRVQLLASLEDCYDVIISSDDLSADTFRNVDNIVRLIQKVMEKNVK